MPQQRCHSRSSSSCGADPSAVWLLTLFFFAGLLNHSCSWSVYIMSGCVPLFLTIYHVADQNCVVRHTYVSCAMARGSFQSPFRDPKVAMHLILFHYNSSEWLVLPFIFFVRKFLQLPVQVPMGSLACPVTADHTHHDTGYDEYGDDHESSLYHSSVPFT